MSPLFHFRRAYEQAFMPIFVEDGRDGRKQVEACVEAGMNAIEYTLRKKDAKEVIPWVRKNFPDLTLIVGSTIDNDAIVEQLKPKHPQLMTVSELADLGVHGFVAQIKWSDEGIKKYSKTHTIIPYAANVNEAYDQVLAGAQMVKMNGPNLDALKKCRSAATHSFCPVLLTGGMNLKAIPSAFDAGAVMVATGFDLTIKDHPQDVSVKEIAKVMKEYLAVSQESRLKAYPELEGFEKLEDKEWLKVLPHIHHF